ncbi:MAG: hypothetical protein INH41_29725 [Myxococcaceae bacterium]|jgi:hypothetical protein|nr:hypothetical protein [Myxococcaceae bacterium]
MSSVARRRLAIIGGTGPLGAALAARLEVDFEVTRIGASASPGPGAWRADVLSIAEAEVAVSGAQVVVFLARTVPPRSRLLQGAVADVDLLLADSVARAVRLSRPERLVAFTCGEGDEREAVLRASGVPVAVLSGGGDDPAAALERLVRAEAPAVVRLSAWNPPAAAPRRWSGRSTVLSLQRLPLPVPWVARQAATAYFEWLPTDVPLVRTVVSPEAVEVKLAGVSVLRLRRRHGECDDDVEVLEVRGGALVGAAAPAGVFEFRRLAVPGPLLVTTLRDFQPALPWLVYRATQGPAHARTMRRFGEWLSRQTALATA